MNCKFVLRESYIRSWIKKSLTFISFDIFYIVPFLIWIYYISVITIPLYILNIKYIFQKSIIIKIIIDQFCFANHLTSFLLELLVHDVLFWPISLHHYLEVVYHIIDIILYYFMQVINIYLYIYYYKRIFINIYVLKSVRLQYFNNFVFFTGSETCNAMR